jgi:hypothetical protein
MTTARLEANRGISPIGQRGGPLVSETAPAAGFPKKRLFFYTIEATNSMKTKDRSCKIGEKWAIFGAKITRILQKKQVFCAF